MDIFTVLFYQPIFNLLIVFYRVFGDNLALAVIGIALLSRIILFPITMRQIAMAEGSQDMNEKVKEIKKKYKDDKDKQAAEMMKIQSEYLPGQLSGCLGLIVQLVLVINIFNVIQNLIAQGVTAFNDVAYPFVAQFAAGAEIQKDFFGIINLGQSAGGIGLSWENWKALAPYIVLALIVAITQYLSGKILAGLKKKDKPETEKEKKQKQKKKTAQAKLEEPEDFGEILQRSTKQTMLILPVIIFVSALNFPAALGIYWTVQSGFVIIQQLIIEKLKKQDDK